MHYSNAVAVFEGVVCALVNHFFMLFGNGKAATGVNVGLISFAFLPFRAVCSHSARAAAFSSLILHTPKARGQMSLAAKRPQKSCGGCLFFRGGVGSLLTTTDGIMPADLRLCYRFDVRSEGPRRLLVGRRRVIVVRCKNLGVSFSNEFIASYFF